MRPAVSYCEPWQGQNQPPILAFVVADRLALSGCSRDGCRCRSSRAKARDPWRRDCRRSPAHSREDWRCARAGRADRRPAMSFASAISLSVRWRMKIGLPRHITVIAWPASTWERSTSVRGQRQRRGVRDSSGRAAARCAAAAPIAAKPLAAIRMTSRRVGSSSGSRGELREVSWDGHGAKSSLRNEPKQHRRPWPARRQNSRPRRRGRAQNHSPSSCMPLHCRSWLVRRQASLVSGFLHQVQSCPACQPWANWRTGHTVKNPRHNHDFGR